jgi:hypothetical protein
MQETASQVWTRLDGVKQPLMRRIERYAALTIPKVCLPPGYNPESTDETHDYQSLGAQAVNHVVNKLMLALFAPSRPFMRVQLNKQYEKKLAAQGLDLSALQPVFAEKEMEAVRELDARAQRPKLYQLMRHLVVTGNVLMCLDDKEIRTIGIRYFCVKRDIRGRLHTLIIRERVKFNELDQQAQAACYGRHKDDDEVDFYKLFYRQPTGDYTMSQWVNETRLPTRPFDGKWPEEKFPYRVLTWDLADESDYATGLVEEYSGDLEALSILSESVVDGGVLGAEVKYLVDPAGMTTADDLNNSKNGDALPGKASDVEAVTAGNHDAIRVGIEISTKYEQRIARGFLLQSAVTRDAERVTAEEVRLTAQELETAFGGVYSTLAPSVQKPIALWLLKAIDLELNGTQLEVTIITGLDALSRNGDLENLRAALGDLAQFAMLPPMIQARINFDKVAAFVGQGRGVNLTQFLKSEAQFQQEQVQAANQRVNEAGATAGAETSAQVQAQGPQPQ